MDYSRTFTCTKSICLDKAIRRSIGHIHGTRPGTEHLGLPNVELDAWNSDLSRSNRYLGSRRRSRACPLTRGIMARSIGTRVNHRTMIVLASIPREFLDCLRETCQQVTIQFAVLSSTVPRCLTPEARLISETFSTWPRTSRTVQWLPPWQLQCRIHIGSSSGVVVFRHHSGKMCVYFNESAQRLEALHAAPLLCSVHRSSFGHVSLALRSLIVSYVKANIVGGGTLMFPWPRKYLSR